MKKDILLLLAVLPMLVTAAVHEHYLFRDGTKLWQISYHTPEDAATPAVQLAAQELERALRLASDVTEAATKAPAANPTITEISLGVDSRLIEEEIRIWFEGEKLRVSGGSPVATLHAVYYFLQKGLGVRWLWPGKDGEIIPKKKACRFSEKLDVRHLPSIKYRGFHMCGDWYKGAEFREWMARNFINIHRHGQHFPGESRFIRMWSDHNVRIDKSLFAEHPDYFAEINGKRVPTQVCLSHPEVDRLMYEYFADQLRKHTRMDILYLMLSDNQEYCRCTKCGKKSVSTAWFDFYNRLTDKLKVDFPKVKFATIAYQGYIDVPDHPVRNTEFVEYATHSRCNIHPYGDPTCERNKKVYKAMQDWAATGTPVGDYAYEFDVFSGPEHVFLPFYSLIKNTVQKTVDLQQVTLIPEVGMSPRSGPDYVTHLKDRFALYLYAQLMWNHTKTVEGMIDEWCTLVFGNAAGTMKEYYTEMDRQWSGMKIHYGILGKAFGVAPHFLTPDFRKKAEALLLTAEKETGENTAAIDYEKKLYAMWLKQLSETGRVSLPKNYRGKSGGWFPGEKLMKLNVGKGAFRFELCAGFGAEVWIFEATAAGKKKQLRRSTLGVEEQWDADWTLADGVATIPFASLGVEPKARDKWEMKTAKGKESTLYFSPTSEDEKRVFYWEGNHKRDGHRQVGLTRTYNDFGWAIDFVKPDKRPSTLPPADIYFLNNPAWGDNKFTEEYWKFLRKEVKEGATAVFASVTGFPLDKIMDDSTFHVGVGGIGSITLSRRKAKTIYSGEWTKKPYDIAGGLWGAITPAYCLHPAKPDAWRILATLAENGNDDSPIRPFLMVRPYGKGTVICIGNDPRFNLPGTIANILYHRDALCSGLENKKSSK